MLCRCPAETQKQAESHDRKPVTRVYFSYYFILCSDGSLPFIQLDAYVTAWNDDVYHLFFNVLLLKMSLI